MAATEKFPEALLDQYLDGTISEADRKMLMDWFDSFSDEEVNVLTTKECSSASVREDIWRAIEARTAMKAVGKTQADNKRLSGSFRSLYKTAAAACLVLAALTWWAVANRDHAKKQPTPEMAVKKSGAPSGDHNGAILTLSSGQRVVLDSAGMGQIAQQGTAQVIQQGGQIRYLHANNQGAAVTAYNTMTTPRGKQFALVLPDGTKVWLNAASSITYPVQFAANRRSVQLTGEAYFEVAHVTAADHKTRIPFDVQSGQLNVEVLGTHFNIKNYPEDRDVKTTLLEGSVQVHYGNNGAMRKMVPGQQATVKRTDPDAISLEEVDTRQAIAWKNGLFYFKDEPLGDILEQVSRWYDVAAGADPAKIRLRFSGVVSKRARLADLLAVLSATGVVQFKISDNKVYGY